MAVKKACVKSREIRWLSCAALLPRTNTTILSQIRAAMLALVSATMLVGTSAIAGGGSFAQRETGSSSTVGLWMLASAATYPEAMRRELLRLSPISSYGSWEPTTWSGAVGRINCSKTRLLEA
jgi:hypothetical protein